MTKKHIHEFLPVLVESELIFGKTVIKYYYLGEKCAKCNNYKVNDYFMIMDLETNKVKRTMTNEEIRAAYPDLPIIKRKWA